MLHRHRPPRLDDDLLDAERPGTCTSSTTIAYDDDNDDLTAWTENDDEGQCTARKATPLFIIPLMICSFRPVSSSFSFFPRMEYVVLFLPLLCRVFLLHAHPFIHSSLTRIIASTRLSPAFLFIQSLRACCNHSVPPPPTCYLFFG